MAKTPKSDAPTSATISEVREMLEVIPHGVTDMDTSGVLIFANAAYHRMLGYAPGELIGKNAVDLLADDDARREFPELLQKIAREEPEPSRYHARDRTKDGRIIDIEVDWRYKHDESGSVVGFISAVTDITARKSTDGQLQRELELSTAMAELSAALVSSATNAREIAAIVLRRARALTASPYGYVASIDRDSGNLIAHTLSAMMGKECRVEGGSTEFPIGPDGRYPKLWGHPLNEREAFYTNSPTKHPASTGTPKGHVPIKSFLSAPALIGERLVGQIAVANNPSGYTESDLEAITKLARLYALFLERVRAEENVAELSRFPSENPNPVMRISAVGELLYSNDASKALLPRRGQTGKGSVSKRWRALVEEALSSGKSVRDEIKRGERIFSVTFAPVTQAGYVNVYALDVTERKSAEDATRREHDFTDAVLDTAGALVVVLDKAGKIVRFNRACEEVTGYSFDEVEGKPFWDIFLLKEEQRGVMEAFEELGAGDFPGRFENHWVTKDGSPRLISWRNTTLADASGKFEFLIGTGIDITEQRRMEDYHSLGTKLLEVLNRPASGTASLKRIISLIREFTDLDAVGIRLSDGEDFPYYVTGGFPGRFVEMERHLCVHADDGETVRDEDGNPVLQCMCGNVLRGRTDPSMPFFTEGGSFWTNSTTALLASTSREERGAHTRNTCNSEGYESVALIPIRADDEIVGLLQLNDTRTDRFTPMTISIFEQIGTNIGMALKRQLAEEHLRELNETLEHRVAERTVALEKRAVQLRALASQLTKVEERERRRLALILHDHLQQTLVAAKLKLGSVRTSLEEPELREAARQADDYLQQCIDTSRSLAVELAPPVLYDAGFKAAVEWLARHTQEQHGLQVSVGQDGPIGEVPEEVAVLLFTALRELLFNVVKHAKVDVANLSLHTDNACLVLTVQDDGRGFDMSAFTDGTGHPDGFGLFNIRERLEIIGGRMDVQSAPGRGTRVTLTAPLPTT